MTEWTPRGFYNLCMTMEKAGAINRVWMFPYYCRRRDSENKWGFICDDQEVDANADLPIKYQPMAENWGVQIMQYLIKVLPKEAKALLDGCGTDGHQALQQLHLKFNPIHFRYQTDQCDRIPVQENQTIEEYVNKYRWYQINKARILDETSDIGSELAQDMFISNMKRFDEVRSIVLTERKSPDQFIADRYKKEHFFNSIISLHNGLHQSSNVNARSSFRGRSQSRVNSVVPYDDDHHHDDWNGPAEYDYCRPGTDPDFSTYQSLMSLAFGDSDVNSLAYGDKHAQKIFSQAVMQISGNLNRAFDTSRACALCGKAGHSFDDCEELKDQAAIRKAYISLRLGLQKLKGIATNQRRDINSIRSYKISYVNSVDLLPASAPSIDPSVIDKIDRLEQAVIHTLKAMNKQSRRINSIQSAEDNDDDDDSQSSLNSNNLSDFLKGAQK